MKGRLYGGDMKRMKVGILFFYLAASVLCCVKEKNDPAVDAENTDAETSVEEIQAAVDEETPALYWRMPPALTSMTVEEAVSGIEMSSLAEDGKNLIKDRLLGKLIDVPYRGNNWWYISAGEEVAGTIHYSTIDDVEIFVLTRWFRTDEDIYTYDLCEKVLVYPHYGKELWLRTVEGVPNPGRKDSGEISVLGLITFPKYSEPPEKERKHCPPEVLIIDNNTGEMKIEENTDNRYEVFLNYGVPYRYGITPEILLSDWRSFGKTDSGYGRRGQYFRLRRENDIYTITYTDLEKNPPITLVESGSLEMCKETYMQEFREFILTTENNTFRFQIYPFGVYYEDYHPMCFMTSSFIPEGKVGYERKNDIIRPYPYADPPHILNPNILTWVEDISFITDDNVRLREGPGTSEAVVKVLKNREILKFLEISEEREFIDGYYDHWYKIKTEQGDIGWVYGMYISFPSHGR
jgi:hypothetical protein